MAEAQPSAGRGEPELISVLNPDRVEIELQRLIEGAKYGTPPQFIRERDRVERMYPDNPPRMKLWPLALNADRAERLEFQGVMCRYLPSERIRGQEAEWIGYSEYSPGDLTRKLRAIREESLSFSSAILSPQFEPGKYLSVETVDDCVAALNRIRDHRPEMLSPISSVYPDLGTLHSRPLYYTELRYLLASTGRTHDTDRFLCFDAAKRQLMTLQYTEQGKLQTVDLQRGENASGIVIPVIERFADDGFDNVPKAGELTEAA